MIPIPAYNNETNKMKTFNVNLVIEPVFTDRCCLHMYNSLIIKHLPLINYVFGQSNIK